MAVVLDARLRYETAMAEWAEWAITPFSATSPVQAPATADTQAEEVQWHGDGHHSAWHRAVARSS
jgi:hypothetical protein